MTNSISISVCSIATPQDWAFVEKLRTPLPSLCERIVMLNQKGDNDIVRFQNITNGIKVFNCTYSGDLNLAELRNRCIEQTESEWLIWQDADDLLCFTEDEFEEIRSLPPDIAGVEVPVVMFNSETETFYISYQIKIHRNSKQIYYEYACHETVRECFARNGLQFIRKNYLIRHYGYEDKHRYREHLLRNRDILLKDIALNYPNNEYLLDKLKQTLNELSV